MAASRLHIICGNCGCNNKFSYEINPHGRDISGAEPKFKPAVWIRCDNCKTLHDLIDFMPEIES